MCVKGTRLVLSLATASIALAACSDAALPITTSQRIIESRPYHIDQIYRSMEGPIGRVLTTLDAAQDKNPPELLWVTAIRSDVVQRTTGQTADDGLMCHTNVSFARFRDHHRTFYPEQATIRAHPRVFTLSQGQLSVSFPSGFGIPMLSNSPLAIDTQALNLNDPGLDEQVRIRTTIDYVRDADLETPMVPLIQRAAQGAVLIRGKDGYHGVSEADPGEHGPGCVMGTPQTASNIQDPFGRVFAAHWQVPPGREVNHALVTQFIAIPYDTTVHYIAVHLHPFATSLELRDLTADETVFRSEARGPETGIGLEHVDSFSSLDGIPIYADHQYELVSVYENTSGETQDSMAVMFLYLRDLHFTKPAL
jgi:hypothetical protein